MELKLLSRQPDTGPPWAGLSGQRREAAGGSAQSSHTPGDHAARPPGPAAAQPRGEKWKSRKGNDSKPSCFGRESSFQRRLRFEPRGRGARAARAPGQGRRARARVLRAAVWSCGFFNCVALPAFKYVTGPFKSFREMRGVKVPAASMGWLIFHLDNLVLKIHKRGST